MVRSHALYPIELRAHRGEIASSNYNGNRIVSPNPIAEYCSPKNPKPSWISLPIRAKSRALAVEIPGLTVPGLAEREDL
jgi:hypothetical protein